MAFFGTPTVDEPEDEYGGLLPARPQSGGLMGFLRNPAVSAALGGMSQGFTQAALAGTSTGQGLAAGLAGGAQGYGAWAEEQAKQAADRLNKTVDARRGETDYRYQLGLIAKRYMRDEGMSEQDALIKAQDDMANRSFEQRGQLADKSYQNQLSIKYLEDQLAKGRISYEQAMRLANEPDIAAAIEREKLKVQKDFSLETEAQGAEVASGMMNDMKADLALLPSPAKLKIEGGKAFFGYGDETVQGALGRIAVTSGQMVKYVEKLPGASTDKEFPLFTGSAAIISDPNASPQMRIAAASQAQKYFDNIVARQKARKSSQGSPAPAAAKPSGGKQELRSKYGL